MNDRRALFAILGALGASGILSAETSQTQTIEAARRELEKRPPASSEAVPAPADGWPRVEVPTISIDTPTGSTRPRNSHSQETETDAEKSEGWLVDGVRQLSEEERRAKQNESPRASDDERESGDAREDAHPFGEYMARWLTPGDRALLSGLGGPSTNDAGFARAPQDSSGRFRSPETPAYERVPDSGSFSSGTYPPTPVGNPYLDDMPGTAIPVPVMNSGLGTAGASSLPAASAPANVRPAASTMAPTTERSEELPSPTERLIDDRKYFPQLRRF